MLRWIWSEFKHDGKHLLCKHRCENCKVQAIFDTRDPIATHLQGSRTASHLSLAVLQCRTSCSTFLLAVFQTYVAHKSVWSMGHCWCTARITFIWNLNGTWLQQSSDLVSPLRSLLSDFLQLVLQIFAWAQDSCRVECQYQSVDVFVFCQLHLKRFFTYLWMSKPNPICGMIRYYNNEICKGLRTFYVSGWVKILSMTKLPQHER